MGCFLGCVIVDGGRGGCGGGEERERHGACWGGSSGEGEGEAGPWGWDCGWGGGGDDREDVRVL